MIPIRDTVRSRTVPGITILLIAANVWVFAYEVSLGPRVESFVRAWALIPVEFSRWVSLGGHPGDAWRFVPLISSMFLHGGWAHVIGNMWFLWIFGDNVEDRLGHKRFLIFYLLCGVSAAAAQIYAAPTSALPVVGASGAVAGVLGAYFVTYPRSRVLTLVPIFIFPWFVEVPALVFLGLWFLMQFLTGIAELNVQTAHGAGVAWWAHVGGFATGIVLCVVMRQPRPRRRVALTSS